MKKLIARGSSAYYPWFTGNKKRTSTLCIITTGVDSIRQQSRFDPSGGSSSSSEEPKPTEAGQSFDDFIYNLASDDAFAASACQFPVAVIQGEKTNIEERNWKA